MAMTAEVGLDSLAHCASGSAVWAANERLSDPPVLVPRQVGEIFLAGLVVNQADDECPHDRTSLLITGGDRGSLFQDVFAEARNGFV
jgi:hypothetical protein